MKKPTAVLHLKSKSATDVYQLGGQVGTNMGANSTIFPDPDPTLTVFNAEVTKLDLLMKSKDGSKQKNQAIQDQTDEVYDMLKSEMIYVNKVADGDRSIILLSGFDCSEEPVTHDIPGKALIKRVEDGSVACSAKVFVVALFGADRYKIEITTTPDDPASWKTVLDYGALNRMEIRNLVRGQEIHIRVTGGNTHGWGIPSEVVSFIPR